MAHYASPTRPPAATQGRDAPRQALPAITLASPAGRALRDTAQRLNDRPMKTLQRAAAALADRPVVRLSREASMHGGAPIQLYTMPNGAKLSGGEELCLVAPQQLYAGEDQFTQANQIPGHVHFDPGAQIPDGYVDAEQAPNLHRVTASLKPDFQVPGSFYRTGGDGEVSYPSAQDNDENAAYLNNQRDEEGTLNVHNNQQYQQAQIGLAGPLLPSNCEEASRYVTGTSSFVVDQDNPAVPGSRYLHSGGGTDADEWAFHYAGIIMADGSDHVTMENAGARVSENYSKKLMDKTWSYKMYGTAHGQTFADAYGADLPGGAVSIQRPAPPPVDDGPDDDDGPLLGNDDGNEEQGWSLSGALSACWRGLTSCLPGGGGNGD